MLLRALSSLGATLRDRLQGQPRTRRAELAALRARFVSLPSLARASAEERALAAELRQLREQVSAALAGVDACASCARPCGAAGSGAGGAKGEAFAGGACCGGRTDELFSADELYALALGGTRLPDLVAPRGEHRGCAFRGSHGCSLAAADRPTLCARYLCAELQSELQASGRRHAVKQLCRDLRRVHEALGVAREAREVDALFEDLADELSVSCSGS